MQIVFHSMVVIIILFILFLILFSIAFQQVGATCGFYALTYIVRKKQIVNKKKLVKNIIIQSIEKGHSEVGEIFNINYFKELDGKFFNQLNIEIKEIENQNELDELLKLYHIILPLIEEKSMTPHYVILELKDNENYYVRDTIFFFKKKKNKKRVFESFLLLSKYKEYEWEKYYKNNIIFLEKILFKIVRIIHFLSSPKLYCYLEKNKRKKTSKLYNNQKTVDMENRIILVKK